MEKIRGRIIQGIGGFYTVKPLDSLSLSQGQLIETKAKGLFRHQKITPVVGDIVDVVFEGEQSFIDKIHLRSNEFIRPSVANVDMALLVFAAKDPEPDLLLLDKLLIAAVYRNTQPIICVTKTDLDTGGAVDHFRAVYGQTGYPILFFNDHEGDDLMKLKRLISDHTAFMAGPSGVGKSSLANRLCGTADMAVGDISRKLGRGRHTTRHVAFLPMDGGGYLLDTPGFSSLDVEAALVPEELGDYFPEFYAGNCKFNTCTHRSEPGCAVKAAVDAGEIHPLRYEHYLTLFESLNKNRH